MDDVRLSLREWLILKDIESALRRGRRTGGPLRTPRRSIWLPTAVGFLVAASGFLMVAGIRTSDPAVIWAFAAVWPFALLQAFRLLCRCTTPHGISVKASR
ncbi:DUF3040 domain-containing protein [Streptomyces sp. SAS_270]|uniref:DUF3040 domain-containing protein n=1 Tax=Streptomyces sp. SAS_270 TaxID=3412748 RepID=UPI00403D23FD